MRIHQALHSYERGHRLLAASTPLPPAASIQLLDLTDANDVEEDARFPSVIAAFPVSDTGFYAVSKTWPARGVGRTGSVRTHSLLIDRETLPLLSPSLVLSVFARSMSARRSDFERPVELNRRRSEKALRPPDSFSTMLWALYEAPTRPVIAVLDDLKPEARQYLLLRLLFQQGPALGHDFALAEAPHWARHVEGRPFDLHVTGEAGLPDLRQGVGDARLVTRRIESPPPPWAQLAGSELGAARDFDKFVREWASDLPHGRVDFPVLVDVWGASRRQNADAAALMDLLRLLDRAFPRRGEATELKMALFGPAPARVLASQPDHKVLQVIAGAPSARCLSIPDMRIDERMEALWTGKASEGYEVLACIDDDHLAEMARAIVTASLPFIPKRELDRLARRRPTLWALLLSIDPQVANGTELETMSNAQVEAAIEAVDQIRSSQEIRRRSIAALAVEVSGSWRERLQKQFLDEVEADPCAFISRSSDLEPWVPGLSMGGIASWLNNGRPSSDDVLSAAAYFTSESIDMVATERWLMAADALKDAEGSADPQSLVSLLAASLRSDRPPADLLAIRVLDSLWSLSADLPKGAIKDLETLGKDDGGGKSHRTLLALVSKGFREFPRWRPSVVLELSSEVVLRELLEEDSRRGSRSSSIGYRLVQELPIPGMTSQQYDALQHNLAKHAKRDDLLGMLESVVRRVTGWGT